MMFDKPIIPFSILFTCECTEKAYYSYKVQMYLLNGLFSYFYLKINNLFLRLVN